MELLVSMNEARAHILLPPLKSGSPSTDYDKDQALKLAAAQETILEYLGSQADPDWDAESVPQRVKAAILMQFAELNRFRGDDTDKDVAPQSDGYLSPQITNLLRRLRDPVLR